MDVLIQKFRKNDLVDDNGKQIEFSAKQVRDFFEFSEDSVPFSCIYKSINENDPNNGTVLKLKATKSSERGDYKFYGQTETDVNLKRFFIDSLDLNDTANINDFLSIKKTKANTYEFSVIPANSELGKYFELQGFSGKILNLNDDKSIQTSKIDKSLNRIIFGAPGTGKSHKLEIESESFINQKSVQTDIDQQIKDEIAAVVKLSGKLNFLAAIGIKYSDQLKNKSRVQLQTAYNLNGVDELYVGSRAKELLPQIQINEEEEDKESQIKEHVKKAQSGDNMLQMLTAIGMKYSDYLSESSMPDLKKTYDLKSDAQMWWLYRGAQAMQALSNETEKKPVKFLERVTFHPNYSYSQFVGTYKPMKSKLNQEEITYEYVPGPFMRVYVNAKRNPEKKFLLLIEEINRANVAAVFGDVFQLLDRKNDGISQYPISASEDQKNYLESCGINEDEIAIPANMYIWATMNSADQGVLPMDAAFKRRWDFEYLDVDNTDAVNQIKDIEIPISRDGKKTVKWNEFRTQLNDKLSDIGVNEDKLLGPFFMSKKSLENAMTNPENFVELFESKVIMYLFEDVVKMQPGKLFTTGTRRYSRICKEFEEKGMELFGLDVEVTEVQ